MWGWNESGQMGFPYKCEGSQSLFNFNEHSCQCPKSDLFKRSSDDHVEGEPVQSHQLHVEENTEMEESHGEQREVKSKAVQDKSVNPERSQEVINVQASPLLLDFWTEEVNITSVECGDRHTLYMLGELSCMIQRDSTCCCVKYIITKD